MTNPEPLYDYAEVDGTNARANTFSAKNASPDEIVAIADSIWKKVINSGIAHNDDVGNDKLLEELQEEFVDFNKSFPIILRWLVQARQYKPKAFKIYLLKHATANLDSRKNFLILQAEYLVLLYREVHAKRHPPESEINRYRECVVKQLLDEDEEFVRIQKQVEEELEATQKKADNERRLELYKLLSASRTK